MATLLRLGAAAETGWAAVDGGRAVASTGEDFVCATLDWWPPDKCDYGTCAWGRASLLNLVRDDDLLQNSLLIQEHGRLTRGFVWLFLSQDLSNKVLLNAVRGRRRPAPLRF